MSPCTREIGDLDQLRVVISGMERESLNRRATNRAFQWALDALKDQSRRARLYPKSHPLRALQRGPGNAHFGHSNRSVCCPPLMNDLMMMMTAAVVVIDVERRTSRSHVSASFQTRTSCSCNKHLCEKLRDLGTPPRAKEGRAEEAKVIRVVALRDPKEGGCGCGGRESLPPPSSS